MVNFGGHLRAFKQLDGMQLYVVPYNDIKDVIAESIQASNDISTTIISSFERDWKHARTLAANDFQQQLELVWLDIFSSINDTSNSNDSYISARGAPTGTAFELYIRAVTTEKAQIMLTRLTVLHSVALNNSEGLRKLVKKYDKNVAQQQTQRPQQLLSFKLLPILYSSNFSIGTSLIEDSLNLLRTLLHMQQQQQQTDDTNKTETNNIIDATDVDNDDDFTPVQRKDSEANHQRIVARRLDELDWFQRLINSIPGMLLERLVLHRGFHCIGDRNDRRPLENSLAAYEMAWTNGAHLCECDIALTKDERIVLAHDEDFSRLALDSRDAKTFRHVGDLTFSQLMSMPLKSGNRPPLLIDVLRSARALSGKAKLIIEIKPGHPSLASAVARMLLRHPDLMQYVAVIMSFDAVVLHRLRQEFSTAMASSPNTGVPLQMSSTSMRASLVSLTSDNHRREHSRQLSMDHFGSLYNDVGSSSIGLDLASNGGHLSNAHLSNQAMNHSQAAIVEDEALPLSEMAVPSGMTSIQQQQQQPTVFDLPKIMLLTVSDPPKKPCELQVSVSDTSPINGWLSTDNGSLDGVYMQFEKKMTTVEGARQLKELSMHYTVGIWGYSGVDPDNWDTFLWLVEECNVTFVNTDLPLSFRRDVMVHSNTM